MNEEPEPALSILTVRAGAGQTWAREGRVPWLGGSLVHVYMLNRGSIQGIPTLLAHLRLSRIQASELGSPGVKPIFSNS